MNLKDKNLEKLIKYKLGIFNQRELCSEDLEKVEELSISGTSFSRRKN